MTTLSLVGLNKTFIPGETAVADLNLTIERGELMVLLGPSGCGKTTTLRMIAGLLTPTQGDILFDGRSVLNRPPEKRGAVMVFQEHTLFPFMSVGENVAYGLKLRKIDRAEINQRVKGALTAVQLPGLEERWPDQLSGGQRRRVALARALVIDPQVLLLDEPLNNLDRNLREEMQGMIRSVQKASGISTLFVTHDQEEAVAVADRLGVMMDGRLRQVGRPRDFFENPADADVARFFGAENFLPGFKRGHRVDTAIGDIAINGCSVANGRVLLSIRPEEIQLGSMDQNNFLARVESSSYHAAAERYEIGIDGVRLQMIPPANQQLNCGQQIAVHFPADRISVLPPETKEEHL